MHSSWAWALALVAWPEAGSQLKWSTTQAKVDWLTGEPATVLSLIRTICCRQASRPGARSQHASWTWVPRA